MPFDRSQLSACSQLFSSAVVRQLATKQRSPLFARLVKETGLLRKSCLAWNVADLFDSAFDILKRRGFRDEYVYRAALTHRILLGKHSLRTACMLSEFRVGECKADLTILNGTSTVFEIKSERDSLARLDRQIRNYRRVFASVVVVASQDHVGQVLKETPSDVGVMSLTARFRMSTEREPANNSHRICPVTVLESVRTDEAKEILARLGVEVPQVPNTAIRSVLRAQFKKLPAQDVHNAMLQTLKRSRSLLPLSQLVEQMPKSLQTAALSVPLRIVDHSRLALAVATPLPLALAWA